MTITAEKVLDLAREVRATGHQDTPGETLRRLAREASFRELCEALADLERAAVELRELWRERVLEEIVG